MVCYQRFDEMSPHEVVTEYTEFDEVANEHCRADETTPPIPRNICAVTPVPRYEVLRRRCCEPRENAGAQPINTGSFSLGAVGRITKLLEEPRNSRIAFGVTILPCQQRESHHEFLCVHGLFGEAVFDPVLDHRRDLVVRRWTEGAEQAEYFRTDKGPTTIITSFSGHGWGDGGECGGHVAHPM